MRCASQRPHFVLLLTPVKLCSASCCRSQHCRNVLANTRVTLKGAAWHCVQELSTAAIVSITALKVLGYWIFRGSNSQKDQLRRDPEHPSVRKLQTLQTARGRRLLTSGWWGVARHINYFGDWLMGSVLTQLLGQFLTHTLCRAALC